ncbi:MAG: DUF6351 family protein [Pseudomonadota bacterium]|nr:DUF6351 family protein [Pseudomonadota bacterium]
MSRALRITLIVLLLLAVLLTAGWYWLLGYLAEELDLNPTQPPVLTSPPGAKIANIPAYSGPHPHNIARPSETFAFPVNWGATGPAEPLFAGPRQYPFMCQTLDSELGQPLVDNQQGYGTAVYDDDGNITGYSQDCGLPTRLHYLGYEADGETFFRSDDQLPQNTDNELLVRAESGTINRFIYVLLMPTTMQDKQDQPDLSQWNGKAVYHFKGAIGIGFQQGQARFKRLLKDMRPALEAGYAVLYSTGNETDNHYNIWLQEDTALRVKQQFVSRYGEPQYTIGFGDSGGGLQQYLLSQNHPFIRGEQHGIIDGGVAVIPYPDMITQITYGLDCELLEYYFDYLADDKSFWEKASRRSLVEGLSSNPDYQPRLNFLAAVASLLRFDIPPAHEGATECSHSWRGSAQLVNNPRFNTHYPRYSAQVNDENYWTHWQDNRDYYGTDRYGRAGVPASNVGVQYGLQAWKDGDITAAQFLDLNRKVGSWKPQAEMQQARYWLISGDDSLRRYTPYGEHNMTHNGHAEAPAPRIAGSLEAAQGAYQSGNVFIGRLDIPLIDVRPYKDPLLDIHHSWSAISSRARILKANQGDNPYQSIWISDAGYDARWDAFFTMEHWLDQRNSGDIASRGVPDFASDRCLNSEGDVIAAGDGVWDGRWNQQADGHCTQQFPFYQSSRQVAGDNAMASTLFCELVPVQQALASGVYAPLDATPYRAQLEAIFPQGVCDFRLGDQARLW